jgi:hypothetical protein
MIPYLIFLVIIVFFVVSYFQIGVKPKWMRLKKSRSSQLLNVMKKRNNINKVENLTKDQEYNHYQINKEKEVDRILDKIYEKKKLTQKEINFLDEYNKNKK